MKIWSQPFFRLLLLAAVGTSAWHGAARTGNSQTVKDDGALKVVEVRFDDFLGTVASSLEVKAGDEAGMKFRVEGFSRLEGKNDSGYPEDRVHLDYYIDIRDPLGVPLQPAVSGQVQTLLGPQDADWRPSVEWSARIPATAPPGRYPILIRIDDRIGHQSIEHTATLRVRGQSIKPAASLEIMQVEFAPSDDGPWRPVWYYTPGASVYVRYKVAGYQVADNKQVHVEQDWAVLDAGAQEIVSSPNATTENSRGFYPPRFLQSYFSITLRDSQPGEYKVRIGARDRVGGQSATAEARFVLRP